MDIGLEIISTCVGCGNCISICPERAIVSDGTKFAIDNWSCSLCYQCAEICPVDAIKMPEQEKE